MKFELVDKILEISDRRIVALKAVSNAEEYLQDHFPTFHVLPGVMMIETMVQAARIITARLTGNPRYVLGEVRALRYGSFVRPGEILKVEVEVEEDATAPGLFRCKGIGFVLKPGGKPLNDAPQGGGESGDESAATAVSGKFVLRPIILTDRLTDRPSD